jgi:hypothetical protein
MGKRFGIGRQPSPVGRGLSTGMICKPCPPRLPRIRSQRSSGNPQGPPRSPTRGSAAHPGKAPASRVLNAPASSASAYCSSAALAHSRAVPVSAIAEGTALLLPRPGSLVRHSWRCPARPPPRPTRQPALPQRRFDPSSVLSAAWGASQILYVVTRWLGGSPTVRQDGANGGRACRNPHLPRALVTI